jgi:hypothetical protein
MLRLLTPGPFPLPANAVLTDADLASLLRLDLFLLLLGFCARLFIPQPCSFLSSLQSRRSLLLNLHGTRADQHSVQLQHIGRGLRRRFGPELGFADSMFWEMDFRDSGRKLRKPKLDRDLGLDSGFGVGSADF